MDRLNIHPRIIASLKNAKLTSYATVLSMSAPDIERVAGLSPNDVSQLQRAVAEAIPISPCTTGVKLLQANKVHRLSTGCSIIDTFLQGGLLQTGITEVCGESAVGKTQFCMQLCLTAQLPQDQGGLGSGALYICTEDVFPSKRLHQIARQFQNRPTSSQGKIQFMDNIFIEHAADLEDLRFCIMQKAPVLLSRGAARLIIVDSIAALFRCDFTATETIRRSKEISSFGMQLHRLSHKFGVPVVCINQVSAVVSEREGTKSGLPGKQIKPSLGIFWSNLVTMRLMLSRDLRRVYNDVETQSNHNESDRAVPVRTMEVVFAPHLPNSKCDFIVNSGGVEGLS